MFFYYFIFENIKQFLKINKKIRAKFYSTRRIEFPRLMLQKWKMQLCNF